jgi:hypothetical protein
LDIQKFERDLNFLAGRACRANEYENEIQSAKVRSGLEDVREKLVELYKRNLVKINHSAMELLCAGKLIELGYEDVEVEHQIKENLVCDLFAKDASGATRMVEIETGFVPPEYALQPLTYSKARIASKLSRYSAFSNSFTLGTTPTNVLQIPSVFLVPQELRSKEEISDIKALCDLYYRNPPITGEEISCAKLDSIFVIDVDRVSVEEVKAAPYLMKAQDFMKKS